MKHTMIILILTLIIALTGLFIPWKQALIFYEKNTEDIAAFLPTIDNQQFDITFVHSIHLTDVVEKYEITAEKNIKQYEMIFEEFGIGMPSTVETGEELVYEDGKYHMKNLYNLFEEMKIRNGKTVSKHRFSWIDKEGEPHIVLFNDYFEPGNWYTVKVTKISLFTSWKEVKIHD